MDGPIGEYRVHDGTIVMYPFRNDIWRDNAIHMQKYVCNLVEIISRYEKAYLFCEEPFVKDMRTLYLNNSNVVIIPAKYDDIWARDVGPSFVRINNCIKCVDWKFNAWGGIKEGSYFPWHNDDSFASFVANYFSLECNRAPIVVEGGGIISDGNGTIFTTRSVLLNRNRNPFKTKENIENILLQTTGASRVIWIDQGLVLDETNGHIDNLLSFVNQKELCLAWTDDLNNPNYKRLNKTFKLLTGLKNLNGEEYTIHRIPLPPIQYMTAAESSGLKRTDSLERRAGDVLPASYLNFYLLNNAVLIPAFGCMTDEVVLELFKKIFNDREIIQVYSREPLLGGGGIHCILHEVPLFLRRSNEVHNKSKS